MDTINLICARCEHGVGIYGGCKAFPPPEGVPEEIFRTNKHDKPLEGQKNDLVFTPIKGNQD